MAEKEEKSFFNQWNDAISSIQLKNVEKHACVYCKQSSAIHTGNMLNRDGTNYQFFDCVSCNRYFIKVYEYSHTMNEQKEIITKKA